MRCLLPFVAWYNFLKLGQLLNEVRLLPNVHTLYDMVSHHSNCCARGEPQLASQWHSTAWQLCLLYGENAIQQNSDSQQRKSASGCVHVVITAHDMAAVGGITVQHADPDLASRHRIAQHELHL